MTEYIQKVASEVKNYSLNWTPKSLGSDTVSSATFTFVPNGLSISNVTVTSPFSNCTISGGTPGVTYTISASIGTAGGQTFDETLYCFVEP